jgi:hypothetical protein
MACATTKYLKLVNATAKIAELDANCLPKGFRDLGDFPMLEIGIAEERVQNFNSRGRFKVKDLDIPIQADVTAKIKLKEASLANFALFTAGKVESSAGGSAVDLPLDALQAVAIGDEVLIPGYPTNISALVIKDSAGSPLTLTLNTHYTADLKNGTVKFLAIPGTQPYKFSYTEPARSWVSIVRADGLGKAYQLLVTGENAGANYEKTRVILWKIIPGPSQAVSVKDADANDVAGFELELGPVADLTKSEAAANPLGQYGVWEAIG